MQVSILYTTIILLICSVFFNNLCNELSLLVLQVVKTFNPEAQCFRPIDSVASSLSSLSISPPDKCSVGSPTLGSGSNNSSPTHHNHLHHHQQQQHHPHHQQQQIQLQQSQHNPLLFGKPCGGSSSSSSSSSSCSSSSSSTASNGNSQQSPQQQQQQPRSPNGAGPAVAVAAGAYVPCRQPSVPLTFTTASFAQTKFGSTKLKSNNKRANRFLMTDFIEK